jgi:hypothetical protein
MFGVVKDGIKENVCRNAGDVGKFACSLRIDLTLNEVQLVFQEKMRRFEQVREHDIEYVPE